MPASPNSFTAMALAGSEVMAARGAGSNMKLVLGGHRRGNTCCQHKGCTSGTHSPRLCSAASPPLTAEVAGIKLARVRPVPRRAAFRQQKVGPQLSHLKGPGIEQADAILQQQEERVREGVLLPKLVHVHAAPVLTISAALEGLQGLTLSREGKQYAMLADSSGFTSATGLW